MFPFIAVDGFVFISLILSRGRRIRSRLETFYVASISKYVSDVIVMSETLRTRNLIQIQLCHALSMSSRVEHIQDEIDQRLQNAENAK